MSVEAEQGPFAALVRIGTYDKAERGVFPQDRRSLGGLIGDRSVAMELIGRIASLGLGVMFVVSGVYKLADGPSWPRQAADMGVRRSLALVVPWYELVLGIALISTLLSPWAEIVAALTLVVFTVVIVQRLLDGSRPPCACFGSRSNRPLGRRHLARNVGLLAIAAIAVVGTA
jgi:uncharacterized membrane protein YphA (DoxX/SURF4 family)